MRHRPIPGGIYADARPDGAWVCSIGAIVLSSWGDLGAPRAMLFNRLSPLGLFKVASKSVWPGSCFVYDGSWSDTGRDSPGTQGHGWRPDGTLDILTGGPHQEANGLRYYDPSAIGGNTDIFGTTPGWVTGSPSYGPGSSFAQSKHVARLHEWTDVGAGVFVGQGDQGGTVIQHPTFGHRLLIDGDSRFVQAHRDGNALAIAVTRLGQGDAHCFWLEEHEIGDLPIYRPVEEPPPPPDPEEDEDEEQEPPPMSVSLSAEQEAYLRKRWDELLGPMQDGVRKRWVNKSDGHEVAGETSDVLFQIAAEMHAKDKRIGLYPKSSGTNHRGRGEDILLIREGGKVYWKDVVGSISTRNPVLNLGGFEQSNEPDKWVEPFPVTIPDPVEPPPPPPPPPSDWQKRIEALEARLKALEAKPSGSLNGKRVALKSAQGAYLCSDANAANDNGIPVYANRESAGSWETFTVEEK